MISSELLASGWTYSPDLKLWSKGKMAVGEFNGKFYHRTETKDSNGWKRVDFIEHDTLEEAFKAAVAEALS